MALDDERFVLSGDVLLDLQTGEYYRLNEAAIASFHVGALALPPPRPRARQNPITFEVAEGGFTLLHLDRPVAWLGQDGSRLRLSVRDPQLILWALPHILALKGRAVLHASCVVRDGQAIAFVGPSGAGKTTCARHLAERGARLVSEDLLVFGDGAAVLVGAEASLRRWCAEQRDLDLDTRELPLEGPALPLTRILLISAARRAGEELLATPIEPREATAELLGHTFAEIPARGIWRAALMLAAELARLVPTCEATLPDLS